jgi:YfiH family protein
LDYTFFESFTGLIGVKHAISKRDDSEPAEFSLAYHTGDNIDKIRSNRDKVRHFFGSDMHFVSALQVHGESIHVVDAPHSYGWNEPDRTLQVDALISDELNVALTILTADCVPVLLYDPMNLAIGAVHAGWQGSHYEIVRKTIEKMKCLYGSEPEDIVVGIGPSIGGCCYEVGEEVAKHFEEYPDAVEARGDEKYMLDLKLVNAQQLQEAGVPQENIEISQVCTSCDNKDFFSYRKERGTKGRFMSIIALSA